MSLYSDPHTFVLHTVSMQGVTVVVAAGNEAQDACNVSPASATGAITVGSTDKDDKFSDFSNYGKCVDILAPVSLTLHAMVHFIYTVVWYACGTCLFEARLFILELTFVVCHILLCFCGNAHDCV